jgi:hypothetical protein
MTSESTTPAQPAALEFVQAMHLVSHRYECPLKPYDTIPGLGLGLKLLIGKSAVNRLLHRQIAEAKADADRTRFASDRHHETELLIYETIEQLSRTIVRTSEETQDRIVRALAEAQRTIAARRPAFRSTIPPLGDLPFVGRSAELQALDALVTRAVPLRHRGPDSSGVGSRSAACR